MSYLSTVIRQPTAARVLRWLLVLAALAGLGLGPGAAAPDPMAAAPVGQQLDECHVVRVTSAGTVVSVRLPSAAGVRTQAVAAEPEPARELSRVVPATTLTTIGVCRT